MWDAWRDAETWACGGVCLQKVSSEAGGKEPALLGWRGCPPGGKTDESGQ